MMTTIASWDYKISILNVFYIRQKKFFKWTILIYFRFFLTNIITIFTTNVCDNVHAVYGAGIQTHNHRNMSVLP